ncbi:MAG: hypothetical protein ABI699_05725 [Caldimonas sp.]
MTRTKMARTHGVLLLAVALVAGCDKGSPAAGTGQPAPAAAKPATTAAKSARSGDASAEEVAREARGDVPCPAKSTLPARAAEAPVDDALGVRPGMSYEEAVAAVLCTHPLLVAAPEVSRNFRMNSYGQAIRQGFTARNAEPRVEKSGKQIVQEMQRDAVARSLNSRREDLVPGASKWYLATMGVPGRERVISVGRDERYASEQSPTVEATRAALIKKYGTPTQERRASPTELPTLRWAHDPAGRPVPEGTPLFTRCVSHPDPDVGVSLNPDCGLVVEAMLMPQKSNPDLVDRLKLTIVDQGGGYRSISETEAALGRGDAQRRAQEVEKSAKAGKAPSL